MVLSITRNTIRAHVSISMCAGNYTILIQLAMVTIIFPFHWSSTWCCLRLLFKHLTRVRFGTLSIEHANVRRKHNILIQAVMKVNSPRRKSRIEILTTSYFRPTVHPNSLHKATATHKRQRYMSPTDKMFSEVKHQYCPFLTFTSFSSTSLTFVHVWVGPRSLSAIGKEVAECSRSFQKCQMLHVTTTGLEFFQGFLTWQLFR